MASRKNSLKREIMNIKAKKSGNNITFYDGKGELMGGYSMKRKRMWGATKYFPKFDKLIEEKIKKRRKR